MSSEYVKLTAIPKAGISTSPLLALSIILNPRSASKLFQLCWPDFETLIIIVSFFAPLVLGYYCLSLFFFVAQFDLSSP